MSLSLSMDVSSEIGAGVGPGSLDHLNDPDKRNRVATRSLYNLQQEISAYRAAKDGRGYVHRPDICSSERKSALGIICFLFDFFPCLYVFVVYFCFFSSLLLLFFLILEPA